MKNINVSELIALHKQMSENPGKFFPPASFRLFLWQRISKFTSRDKFPFQKKKKKVDQLQIIVSAHIKHH
jgi:hypothetical protein